ncbi:MAG: PrsW family intramembrane metalloprotease [Verrucomicrobiaceae bacterium]|nr:PrsW family intramembrane metalloprotease [Verrucomicrobiaceae bacterium]
MFHGWRARSHHLTRNRRFLIRASVSIVVAGFTIGCLVQWLRVGATSADVRARQVSPTAQKLRESWRRLETAGDPAPRELLGWLARFFKSQDDLAEELGTPPLELDPYLKSGKLFAFDVRAMIVRHVKENREHRLFEDFVTAMLGVRDDRGEAATGRLRHAAAAEPPAPFANEMLARMLLARDQDADVLGALVREGGFDDAALARDDALHLAIERHEAELLAGLMRLPKWRESATPWMRGRIGALTGDVWMQWRGIIAHQMASMRWGLLALALFAAGLWYVILAQRSDDQTWRWFRPALPVVAGVCSVWPALILLTYQEYHLGFVEHAPFPRNIWYFIAGVGLREELSKLALFAVFLPWLLWRRSEGAALLAAAFVGLGFALEENINYYRGGGGIAWLRFLTANFMHVAMTGITGHALYEMLRWRFARAEKFVAAFLLIVMAHGFYDCADEIDEVLNIGLGRFLPLIILILLAGHFFDLLAATTRPDAGIVSPAAVLLIGSALLIAVMFVVAGATTADLGGIAAVGNECVSVAPVIFVYWRKFEVR